MERSELVKRFALLDSLIEKVEDKLEDSGIELNAKGYYDIDSIEDSELKAQADFYNIAVNIQKKGITNIKEDDIEFLNSAYEFFSDEVILEEPKDEEKEYSREELIEELQKLNPGVEIKYQKDNTEVIYCSKNGSDLKLPEGFEYNDKNGVTNKHHTSSGRYTSVHVNGMENVPSDVVVVGKTDKKAEKKETKKVTKEKKVETKEKGSLSEVVSCLFGQVDKKVNNYVAKHPKINNYFYENRMNRYNHPFGYVGWRAISLPIAGLAFGLAAVQPWLIPVGVGLAAFGAQAIGKFAVAMVRRATKNPPSKLKPVELKKGSYFENLKNAWNKFVNPKKVTKTNNVKQNSKPVETRETKNNGSKDMDKVENLIKAFDKAVLELNLNDVNESKYDYCHSLYKTIENLGALDKIDDVIKKRYFQYAAKISKRKKMMNDANNLVDEFCKSVDNLNFENVNKVDYDKCQFIYNKLVEKYGERVENILYNLPSVTKKFRDYGKVLANKDKTEEKKNEENKTEELTNTYIYSLLQQMYIYDLKTTKDSVNNCEKLLSEIDSKIPETSSVRDNPKYSGLWKKYNHLKQSLVIKNKVLSFVEKVKNIKVSKFVNYTEFKECMDIVNGFSEAEWKDFDSLSNANVILSDFQSILRNSRELVLNQKLEELDIDKCINENNYGQLVEIVKLADNYEKEARDKHKAQPINKLSEEVQLKLKRVRQIVSSLGRFNEYKLDVNLLVNRNDSTIKANYVNYDGEEIELILETRYTGSIEEVTRNVINEISAIEPLVSVEKINIHGLKYVNGNSIRSHR